VRRHREAVGARVAHHHEVALLGRGHHAVLGEHVAALADGAHDEAPLGGALARGHADHRVIRLVQRRADEVVHPRVDAHEDAVARALHGGDPGRGARRPRTPRSARARARGERSRPRRPRRGMRAVTALPPGVEVDGRLVVAVGHAEAPAHVDELQRREARRELEEGSRALEEEVGSKTPSRCAGAAPRCAARAPRDGLAPRGAHRPRARTCCRAPR
jgi:hypothetical protein